ncbi:hypothetical protein DES38_101222 [Streptohalobacillus salinus]|uniref:Uncharacterized protein n=1 Tax=Streptohalobacillus salinus TaxID=621096 RepID=A0A2V3WH11_9BACI|nr:hypothetical protein [Streptohalobacillus salinus]PXW93139.1 hypothetical protein DES38_101222 [Streptohalobacillus salinus]
MMGYVLPVDNYQYQAYHNRVTQPEVDPYQIEHPARVEFFTDNEVTSHFQTMDNYYQGDGDKRERVQIPVRPPLPNPIFQELTGLGQTIDAYV